MKKIILLLLSTIASYGQAVFDEGIQITGNANSATATKVNVQEANGKVNTQTINTGFNKNIGLGGSDVVGATTLLNQYSTTPVDWTATAFNSGQVVFHGGKQWIAKMATVAGDVPSVSSKWEEITFEALSNKTTTVDQTIIDGSTNAVSGNAVFDGLALKSNIGHTHVASQITDLSKASVGLGNVDNTSDLSKPLSTATINALATKFPTPIGLTTNYLPKWNGSGFWNSQIFDNGTNIGIGTTSPYNKFVIKDILTNGVAGSVKSFQIEDASGGNSSGTGFSIKQTQDASINAYFTLGVADSGHHLYDLAFEVNNAERIRIIRNGNVGIGTNAPTEKIDVVGNGKFSGTISASPATTANQVVVKSQLDAVAARPYKVYTAVYTQQGTANPSFTVLENTIGSVSWSRTGTGSFVATSSNLFTLNKTFITTLSGTTSFIINATTFSSSDVGLNFLSLTTGDLIDGVNTNKNFVEIRVYL